MNQKGRFCLTHFLYIILSEKIIIITFFAVLLGMVIDPSGLIPEADVKRVEEFGEALKERYGTSAAETSGKGKNMALRLLY